MTTRSLTLAQIARAIRAAQACGVVAVMTRDGIVFAKPEQVTLPSPETERLNSCDIIFGTG